MCIFVFIKFKYNFNDIITSLIFAKKKKNYKFDTVVILKIDRLNQNGGLF